MDMAQALLKTMSRDQQEWENQFGLPVEEHRKQLQVNIFNGYTVFGIRENKKPTETISETAGTRGSNNE